MRLVGLGAQAAFAVVYRVYFVQRGAVPVILPCGGDERTQTRDIARAKVLAANLES